MTARALCLAFAAILAGGCTMVDSVRVNTGPPRVAKQRGEIFMTAGPLHEPYESLGLVQVEKSGVHLFGNVQIPSTDLEGGFNDLLAAVARERGADGVINVRFHTTMYSTFTRVFFAFPLFFIPLPGNVTITGELVRLLPEGAGPPAAATPEPAPPAPPAVPAPTSP